MKPSSAADCYEAIAIRYATRYATRGENFVRGDRDDAPMAMDYYVWVVRNEERCIVVDTGFNAPAAKRRGREYLRTPAEGLLAVGVRPAEVEDVVISHMHYDHAGGYEAFPKARFHVQSDEMNFATGRYMTQGCFAHGYEVEDVCGLVRLTFAQRVIFHSGDAELAHGVSLHRVGGHTMGMQCVRVRTQRGWVVLASDACHYYEHFEKRRPFPVLFNESDVLAGYDFVAKLADSPDHVVPGHDPLVLVRYPQVSASLAGIAVRLDLAPAPMAIGSASGAEAQ